jgi:UDP-glucuronate 4-epimerase
MRLPFTESGNVDHPVSLYAATKKEQRADGAHPQSYLHHPDDGAALLHRVRPAGPAGHGASPLHEGNSRRRAVNIFNGKMQRDFTYIDEVDPEPPTDAAG